MPLITDYDHGRTNFTYYNTGIYAVYYTPSSTFYHYSKIVIEVTKFASGSHHCKLEELAR